MKKNNIVSNSTPFRPFRHIITTFTPLQHIYPRRFIIALMTILVIAGGLTFPNPAHAQVSQMQSQEQIAVALNRLLVADASRTQNGSGWGDCVAASSMRVIQNEWHFVLGTSAAAALGTYLVQLNGTVTSGVRSTPNVEVAARVSQEIASTIAETTLKVEKGTMSFKEGANIIADFSLSKGKMLGSLQTFTAIVNALKSSGVLAAEVGAGVMGGAILGLLLVTSVGCAFNIPISGVTCDPSGSSDLPVCDTNVAMLSIDDLNFCAGMENQCQQQATIADVTNPDGSQGDDILSDGAIMTG